MRKNLILILTIGATLTIGAPATSTATNYVETCLLSYSSALPFSSCPPHLIFGLGGGVFPNHLPKHELTPVAVMIQGKISTDNGAQPSALREMIVDVDKNVTINAAGLPTCKRSQLTRGRSTAERVCHGSIIGTGEAHAEISSLQQGLFHLPLTLFNGGAQGNATTMFILSSIAAPTPTPLLATVTLSKVHDGGRYGLQAIARIPRIANGSGSLRDFTFKVKRLFTLKGTRQSYLSARCPDGHLNASVGPATFKNEAMIPGVAHETLLRGTVVRPCIPKG